MEKRAETERREIAHTKSSRPEHGNSETNQQGNEARERQRGKKGTENERKDEATNGSRGKRRKRDIERDNEM